MKTQVLTTLLISGILSNVTYAGNPADWIVKGEGSIIDGKRFSLCSEDQGGCLRIKERPGANIGWTSGENDFMRIERSSGGDQPLKCGENFAIFIEKEYLIDEVQNFGINLSSRTKNKGYYQWTFDCGDGEVPTNQVIALRNNNHSPIVGCKRVNGVNLCFSGDVRTLPSVGNVRTADISKLNVLRLLQ